MKKNFLLFVAMMICTVSVFAQEIFTDQQGFKYTLNVRSHAAVVSGHTDDLKSEIVIPETIQSEGNTYSVTSIGNRAFLSCQVLTSVTIPNSVTSIGDSAFYNAGLTSVTIPNSVRSIGMEAFSGCPFTSVTIPSSVTIIDVDAFSNCPSLTSVTILDGITKIESEMFMGCWSLTSVTIPNSVTSINPSAFSDCHKLTSVTIPNSVTYIDDSAFRNTALTSVTIPSSVTYIGPSAFGECINVTDVYCYADPKQLTWESEDDFKEERATKCHVLREYLKTYQKKFNDVNVTFVGDLTKK